MTCTKDDEEFIRNVRERNIVSVDGKRIIKGGWRVILLWRALRCLPSSLQKRVFVELLQGSDDGEDVWLWNEGDEALMKEGFYWWGSPPPWHSAATALQRRLARTSVQTLRKGRVQSTAFEMRVAMIYWLALASTAYRDADKGRGVEWDMKECIHIWLYSLPDSVDQWLARRSRSYDYRAFTEPMDQAGHSCYKGLDACWLLMTSQLLPTQCDQVIYPGYGHSCTPCLAHKPTLGSESLPLWTPSPALVALRAMWDEIEGSRNFSKWLLDQPIYGLNEANGFFSSLPQGTDEDKYLSWVNTYPAYLRCTVVLYTLKEWQAMDDCIKLSARGQSLNICSWWAAMCWKMIPDVLPYSSRVKRFITIIGHYEPWRVDFLPPPTPAPEIRDAIRDSGHTCWKEHQMDNYVAAMAFLNEDLEVVGIDVRKDSRCQSCWLQWHLKDLGETLPVEEPAFSTDLTELLVMLPPLMIVQRNECSRRTVAWDDIIMSVQKKLICCADSLDGSEESEDGEEGSDDDEASRNDESALVVPIHQSHANTTSHGENDPRPGTGPWNPSQIHNFHQSTYPNLPGSVPNSNDQEQQNLHYTLDDGDHQSRNMRTDYIDLNDPHHPQLLISQAHHLTENITDIFHRDINILYVQHNSDGSQHDNYSAIPMAINNAGQDQDNAQHPVFHDIQPSSYMNSTRSGDASYSTYGQASVLYDQTMLQNFEASQTQVSGRRSTPSLISELLNPSVENDMSSQSRDLAATMTQDDLDHQSPYKMPNTHSSHYQQHAMDPAVPAASKPKMIEKIRTFLTSELDRHSVYLARTHNGRPKLPWVDFETKLKDEGLELANWPTGVSEPGKDERADPNKGIAGISYDCAIGTPTIPGTAGRNFEKACKRRRGKHSKADKADAAGKLAVI
ncbi:hypothetical protein C8J56DRAFT_1084970 [Mycena floridula]|nr:hypothetical protein C8J56DRAFT_1084970 [Mycena floridula]